MTRIVKVREPDDSKAHNVYVTLEPLMSYAYVSIRRNTPDLPPSALENDLRAVCEQAGGTWVEATYLHPLVICFETEQVCYRLSRTKNRYRCDVIGTLAHTKGAILNGQTN